MTEDIAEREPTIDEQLAAIEAEEKEDRRAAAEAAAKKRIARYALKKKYEAQTKGKEGDTFAIVDSLGGLIVIARPEGVRWKAYKASDKSEADFENFVRPCVLEPSWDRVAQILETYPGTLDEIVAPFVGMIGVILEGRQKK